MPGFATHYLFGVNTIKKISNDMITNSIKEYPHAFGLGLQGPDLFFYYLPSYLRKSGNIGTLAHHKNYGLFLSYLLESRALFQEPSERDIAASYIEGFLGHYILDTICHPYIYAKSHYGTYAKAYFGHHVYLETDIDADLLAYYKNCSPTAFRQSSTVLLSRKECRVVASILHYAYRNAFPEYNFHSSSMYAAICALPLMTDALRDPYGKKKVLARSIERKALGYAVISPLIASDKYRFTVDPLNLKHHNWRNPWKNAQKSRQSFFELLDVADAQYRKVLNLTNKVFSVPLHTPIHGKYSRELLTLLGDKSYLSGL